MGLVASALLACQQVPADAGGPADGLAVMQESQRRHDLYPYVFEEQTMVLVDRHGNRNTRKLRRYSRVEADGTVRLLLAFDYPPEIRGVALLARLDASGRVEKGIYLPALPGVLKTIGSATDGRFLGSDFTVRDIGAEALDDYRYHRLDDLIMNDRPYFQVEALPAEPRVEQQDGYSRRVHVLRQDNYFIVRTDYFDRRGRFTKRRTAHELQRVDGDMWRANMILMEDRKERHHSLIKIDRRVFSQDYVPPEIFAPDWLFANRHVLDAGLNLFHGGDAMTPPEPVTVPAEPRNGGQREPG